MKAEQEVIEFQYLANKKAYFFFKRLIDLIISCAALILCLPILLVSMLAVRFDSSGPIFFVQERVGKDGKRFNIIKLRTMRQDAEKDGPQWAQKHDSRVTRVGNILRHYRLDELPQLINVIRGDMSIVGPRPERPYFTEKFDKSIPGFSRRLMVKPGLTGWAQVNGGYDIEPDEKLVLDLYYIKKCSVLFDCLTMLKTIPVILFSRGAR